MKIFTSDIGGTNARFALFETTSDGLRLLREQTWSSSGASFQKLIENIRNSWRNDLDTIDAVGIAAAGPVQDGVIRMTNADFIIEANTLKRQWPDAEIHLMNDFEAQGYGVHAKRSTAAWDVLIPGQNPTAASSNSITAVIGAGTGFGTCFLISGNQPKVITTECGFLPLALDDCDQRLQNALQKEHPDSPLIFEHLLSGNGLRFLHHFYTGEDTDPAVFTKDADFPTSSTCAKLATIYGRAARAIAFATLAHHIVIVGGLARKTPALVTHPNFKTEFLRASGSHLEFLQSVTILRDTDGDLGLWGAAARTLIS